MFVVLSGCEQTGNADTLADTLATTDAAMYDASSDTLKFEGEGHLRNLTQLTFGGNNAEAYWNADGSQIVFQSDWSEINTQGCDQIYLMNADGSPISEEVGQYELVSTGKGRTTCSYFTTEGRVLYASTHEGGAACPPPVTSGPRYVWPIYDTFDIYSANPDGSDTKPLITGPGYDAEATVSPDGKYAIFTSTRSGDLELWRYDMATGDVLQLTSDLGYDGGAFFSPDSKKIVWRASRPEGESAEEYKELLKNGMVKPGALNLFVANIDGSEAKQITDLPGANWAPFFHPSGESVIFTTNHHVVEANPRSREFDLFLINLDGTGLERVTHSGTFDAFPMFSPDGKKIAFSSNRNQALEGETNVFVADWVD